MSNRSPNDLDRLFQEGSERHDFKYNPEAWDKMDVLLKRDRRKRRMLRVAAVSFAVGLAAILATVLGPDETLEQDTTPSHPGQVQEHEYTASADQHAPDAAGDRESFVQEESENTQSGASHSEVTSRETASGGLASADVTRSDEGPEHITSRKKNLSGSERAGNASEDDVTAVRSGRTKATDDSTLQHSEGNTGALSNRPHLVIAGIDRPAATVRFAFDRNASIGTLSTDPDLHPLTAGPGNTFAMGLSFHGESVSASMHDFESPGIKVAGQLEYILRGKYSFALGLAYTQKAYGSGPEYYQLPETWPVMVEPTYTDAKCRVLEIPLSAGYYFNGYRNTGFFARAGLTSLIMLREQYAYEYDPNHNYPGNPHSWETKNSGEYLFAVADFSIGFNKRINSALAIQVAPYFQLPLGQVGALNVRMYSIGTAVRINFQPF